MVRNVTQATKAEMLAPHSGVAFVELVTFRHPNLATPLRAANNDVAIVSRGETYQRSLFTVRFPDEKDNSPPSASISVQNVDRRIAESIRLLPLKPKPTADLEVVVSHDLDVVEAAVLGIQVQQFRGKASFVTADLGFDDFLRAPWPADSFTRGKFPGIFDLINP